MEMKENLIRFNLVDTAGCFILSTFKRITRKLRLCKRKKSSIYLFIWKMKSERPGSNIRHRLFSQLFVSINISDKLLSLIF